MKLAVLGCKVLGGSGFPLCVGDILNLAFDEEGLLLVRPDSEHIVIPKVCYEDIVSLTSPDPVQ